MPTSGTATSTLDLIFHFVYIFLTNPLVLAVIAVYVAADLAPHIIGRLLQTARHTFESPEENLARRAAIGRQARSDIEDTLWNLQDEEFGEMYAKDKMPKKHRSRSLT